MEVKLESILQETDEKTTVNNQYPVLTSSKAGLYLQIHKLMNFHEVSNAQKKFLTNTFNLIRSVPIWHIHGEARKPDSMVIGQYYYGKALRRCVSRLDGINDEEKKIPGKQREFQINIQKKKPQKIGSWIDAFVLGDVTICGFGLDFSEVDLWWLIEFKSNYPKVCGKTVYYEPKTVHNNHCLVDPDQVCEHRPAFIDNAECKEQLLKVHGVQIKDLGCTVSNNDDYKPFYVRAIEDIKRSRW